MKMLVVRLSVLDACGYTELPCELCPLLTQVLRPLEPPDG